MITLGSKDAHPSPDTALFGLYCGDVPLATADGRPVRLSLIAGSTDFLSKEARDAKLTGFAQLEAAVITPSRDGALASRTNGAGNVYRFPPADRLPTPWRRVRLDVSADGVEMAWASSPVAKWKPVARRSREELVNDLRRRAEGLTLAPHAPPTWNPAASCGVWCRGAAVAVRNVTVEVPPYPAD